MTVLVTADFNTADSSTVPNFTETGSDYEVVSNQFNVITTSSGTTGGARCNTDLGTVDHYVQAVAATLTLNSLPLLEVQVRFADAANTHYNFAVAKTGTNPNGEWQVYKTVAGVETAIIGSTAYTYAANDVIKLTVSGTTLTGYINGAQVFQTTDSSISTGTKAGLGAYRDGAIDVARWDNFAAGDLAPDSLAPFRSSVPQLLAH